MFAGLARRVRAWIAGAANPAPRTATPDATGRSAAQQSCDTGAELLRQERAGEALAHFERARNLDSTFARAQALRGIALRQLGRLDEACFALQSALDLKPDDVETLIHHGEVCLQLGRFEDAADSFNVALAYEPRSVAACAGLAMAAWEQGGIEEAIKHFRRVVEIDPSVAQGHLYLGGLLHRQGRHEEALAAYTQADVLRPGVAEIQLNCGLMLQKLGRIGEAAARFERAVELKPDFAEGHFNLGNARREEDRPDDAIACYEAAIRIRPDYAEPHNNLANVLRDRGVIDAALTHYRKAIALKPDYADACENMGVALSHQDRPQEALACYEQALRLDPDSVSARLNLALTRLILGDFARGWEESEWRFRQKNPDNRVIAREFPFAAWRGEPLAGKSILIWGEQGIGDELRNASMYQEIIEAAQRCVIECAPKLVALFACSFPAATVVARTDPPHREMQGPFDFQCAAGSLARWLRPSLASFPDRPSYLSANAQRAAYWRQRLAGLGAGLKVGFSWRSSNLKGTRAVICTRLDQWRPIFSVAGVQFISLQYDECRAELAQAEEQFGVRLHQFPEVDLFNDLEEVAALTGALDLVITAPTAVSVMAAALGIPTWRMSYGPDWQLHGTNRNLWHPSMVIFGRRWDQSWDEVIAIVGSALARFAADSKA
jgi:tetratricopeptide (TPR) repeat protein